MHQPHTMLVLTKIVINLALQGIILIHSKYFFASDWFGNSQNRKHHKYLWNVNVLLGKNQYGVKKLNRKQ